MESKVYKVKNRFRDKDTQKVYTSKKTYVTADDNRAKELQKKDYLGEEIVGNETPTAPSILDGNIEQVKKSLEGLETEELQALFDEEKANKKRTSLLKHFEEVLAE